jgi:methylmalonyl-CoA mutase
MSSPRAARPQTGVRVRSGRAARPQADRAHDFGLEQDETDAVTQRDTARAVARSTRKPPVIGITGYGGAGKSSLTDELLMRFVRHFPDRNISGRGHGSDATSQRRRLARRPHPHELARRRAGVHAVRWRRVAQHLATSAVLADVLNLLKYAGFDLIVIETAGIGQSDSEIVDLVDVPMYVMTSEYGAASQLEKIDMLDFADVIALNKFEKRGAEDALRDVRKQWRRNRVHLPRPTTRSRSTRPIASRFNDPGVNKLFAAICARLDSKTGDAGTWHVTDPGPTELVERHALVPAKRSRYLAEISGNGRRARDDASIGRWRRAVPRACSRPCGHSKTARSGSARALSGAALAETTATRPSYGLRGATTMRSTRSASKASRCCVSGRRRPRRRPTSSTCTRSAGKRFAATTTSAR